MTMSSAEWVKERRPTLPFPTQSIPASKDRPYPVLQPLRPKKQATCDMDSNHQLRSTEASHQSQPNAATRATSIPELLEAILLSLLPPIHLLTEKEDPRSVRVNANARTTTDLLHCTEVSRTWHRNILASAPLQRALFLLPDWSEQRSWRQQKKPHPTADPPSSCGSGGQATRPPDLNSIIQAALPAYNFRFWNLEQSHHCAYLILTRSTLPALQLRARTCQGAQLSRMQLARPPVQCLRATIFPVRDEAHIEQVGVTHLLSQPEMRCKQGVTLGMVHEWVAGLLERHRDVAGVKITTESYECKDEDYEGDDDVSSDVEVFEDFREYVIADDGTWLGDFSLDALRGSRDYVMGTRDGRSEVMRPIQECADIITEWARTGGWELKWSTRDGETLRGFARTSPGSANEIVSFTMVEGQQRHHTLLPELDLRGSPDDV